MAEGKYKDPKTEKKDAFHVGWEAMGKTALFGKKGRLTKKQYGVLKIPGLKGSKLKKKKNGPS